MQPKRDPEDRRYWPVWRPGATRQPTSDRYRNLRNANGANHLTSATTGATKATLASMDELPTKVGRSGRTADAVRARSRDLYEALLDRIQQRIESADEFTLSELSQAANVAGRIGLGGDDARDATVSIHIIRDSVPTPEHVPSRIVDEPHALPSGDGTPLSDAEG